MNLNESTEFYKSEINHF